MQFLDLEKRSHLPTEASPGISSRPGVTATADMTVLPGVLECRTLRRTVQVRLESNPAVPRDCPVVHPSPRSPDGNL
jgi:hypothetical protein